ncbi:flavodoxin domain-containing protein [Candidatus Nomurabacteria bacterium]|nr:flavodoxin domain-containing protein [Candidatus Nomurabacteria bacterium]
MKILVVYGSNSGSNFHAAQMVADILRGKHTVKLISAGEVGMNDVLSHRHIVMGSCSWKVEGEEGSPHEDILNIMHAMDGKKYPSKHFALFGCGDSRYTYFCGAVDHMQAFVTQIGAQEILPPLKVDGLYFDLYNATAKIEKWAYQLLGKL